MTDLLPLLELGEHCLVLRGKGKTARFEEEELRSVSRDVIGSDKRDYPNGSVMLNVHGAAPLIGVAHRGFNAIVLELRGCVLAGANGGADDDPLAFGVGEAERGEAEEVATLVNC